MNEVATPREWRLQPKPDVRDEIRFARECRSADLWTTRPRLMNASHRRMRREMRAALRDQPFLPQPRPSLKDSFREIFALLDLPANWDGEGAVPPTAVAVGHAIEWLAGLYESLARKGGAWLAPLISDSADGGVMFEWWANKRKITVYIWDRHAEYIQVWGPNIRDQMHEGPAEPIENFMPVWSWLTE